MPMPQGLRAAKVTCRTDGNQHNTSTVHACRLLRVVVTSGERTCQAMLHTTHYSR